MVRFDFDHLRVGLQGLKSIQIQPEAQNVAVPFMGFPALRECIARIDNALKCLILKAPRFLTKLRIFPNQPLKELLLFLTVLTQILMGPRAGTARVAILKEITWTDFALIIDYEVFKTLHAKEASKRVMHIRANAMRYPGIDTLLHL